jgi:septum site-determining protein MinC
MVEKPGSGGSPPIQIKANRDGFTIVPDPAASFDAIYGYVRERLERSRDFFQHADMVLDLRAKPLGTDELSALYGMLFEKSGVKLVEVKLSDTVSFSVHGEPPAASAGPKPVPVEAERGRDSPVIVRTTCRSGVRVVSPSDCVVLGDVNPGAEIIAAGDIVVFGTLRGLAHAGSGGDASARIWALSIEPNQLRIANFVAVPPRDSLKASPKRFEVAEIQEDAIAVISM